MSLEEGWAPNPRYADPAFRMTFARVVTHYFHHRAWLADGQLLRDALHLSEIPGVLNHGRLGLGGPPDNCMAVGAGVAWRRVATGSHGSRLAQGHADQYPQGDEEVRGATVTGNGLREGLSTHCPPEPQTSAPGVRLVHTIRENAAALVGL
jgi:hypothetical protein